MYVLPPSSSLRRLTDDLFPQTPSPSSSSILRTVPRRKHSKSEHSSIPKSPTTSNSREEFISSMRFPRTHPARSSDVYYPRT